MKPDAVAIGIGVLAVTGAALFVQWWSEQPPDWSVVRAVGEQLGSAAPAVAPPITAITLIEEQ